MPKIDKSKYTKKQIQALLAERKRLKSLESTPLPIKVNEHTNKSYGFVLGNGTSRQLINPLELKQYGKVYGCNAIYREFDPDYLIAVDVKMILEIAKKEYQLKNPNVWTNPNKAYRYIDGINYFRPSKGWSSGPTALWLASQHGSRKIYILGFDYKGIGENNKLVNNMYAGTPNYKKTTDSATYYGNWLRQTATVIKEHKHISYVRVIASDNFCPSELNKFENFSTITVEKFQRIFGISAAC